MEQFVHRAAWVIFRERQSGCKAQRHPWISFCFFFYLFPHFFEAPVHGFLIQLMSHRQKHSSTETSNKLIFRYSCPQACCKPSNICISSLMSHTVVDPPEIIEIKAEYPRIFICRTRTFQNFPALQRIRKSCDMIQVEFLLFLSFFGRNAHGTDRLQSNHRHTDHN